MHKISFNAATTIGSREKNQDVFLADSFLSSSQLTENQSCEGSCSTKNRLCVFAICDGVGMNKDSGPAAEAALTAIKELTENFNKGKKEVDISLLDSWVKNAIVTGKKAIDCFCEKNNTEGTSTIVMLAIYNDMYIEANIGDSPAFILTGTGENSSFRELTVRHNMANLKRLMGAVPAPGEECILLHHLGEKILTFDEKMGIIEKENIFLLCTDGVTASFDSDELKSKLSDGMDTDFFTNFAGKAPEADNCTAIIVSITDNKTVNTAEGDSGADDAEDSGDEAN